MKKFEKLTKRIVLEISKNETQRLRGGQWGNDENKVEARTIAHNTHVNTCFTKNCCKGSIESDQMF